MEKYHDSLFKSNLKFLLIYKQYNNSYGHGTYFHVNNLCLILIFYPNKYFDCKCIYPFLTLKIVVSNN